MKNTAILLLNFGGPETNADVKPFLLRLFSDPNVLKGVPRWLAWFLARLIVFLKAKESKKTYAMIGGGSPQRYWTEKQAKLLQERLASGGRTEKVWIGMNYTAPFIEDTLREMQRENYERIIVVSLFPQFSTTTTGSCLSNLRDALRKLKWEPELVCVEQWHDQDSYTSLVRDQIAKTIGDLPVAETHVLFSAHSLPMKIINEGDPYPRHVDETVRETASDLKHNWSLAFQSRNGPLPWLGPHIDDEIKRLAGQGVRNLIVVPVSFVSDHIETLYELDILYADLSKAVGITDYRRVPTFNDDPRFAEVLSHVVAKHSMHAGTN